MENATFNNSVSHDLKFEDIICLIKEFLDEDESAGYKLTIGTDSEVKSDKKGKKYLELITAIVIYRKGYGGRYFWRKKEMANVKTLREKIYQEVLLSIETTKYFVPELKEKLNGQSDRYDLEIHIDVGEKGETREMIKEVTGMVAGNGFVAKTKPESYAASNVADRHV
ncbi:MAG: hypothetical protein A2857_05095 [Candidatus Levybacteria bacterium RIFCSPHIGHO2_01_FULL_36_15]|nr:MAG: hypothetical protein A2857_05095 [Candidatus Levybacteria bacterium RIFCSPHIGHO2_01_FULL_36_15]OGH37226.1 MAG: hypothetical protein A2905_05985 [Candidatus Levybacteria bacterium RIFCSPLOWO2_01_FULL_36_10]